MATSPVRRLDANHDATFGSGFRNIATGSEAAEQRLRCRLLSLQNDWYLDITHGLPWWTEEGSDTQPFLGGPRNKPYIDATLKAYILATDGIATLDTYNSSIDGKTRKLTVSCSGTTVDGMAFQIIDAGPPEST